MKSVNYEAYLVSIPAWSDFNPFSYFTLKLDGAAFQSQHGLILTKNYEVGGVAIQKSFNPSMV